MGRMWVLQERMKLWIALVLSMAYCSRAGEHDASSRSLASWPDVGGMALKELGPGVLSIVEWIKILHDYNEILDGQPGAPEAGPSEATWYAQGTSMVDELDEKNGKDDEQIPVPDRKILQYYIESHVPMTKELKSRKVASLVRSNPSGHQFAGDCLHACLAYGFG